MIEPTLGQLLPLAPPLFSQAVANRTDACFIRVIGSELVQKYVGEGARMVRELFTMARSKKACIVFFDEIDAIGEMRRDGTMCSQDTASGRHLPGPVRARRGQVS